MSTREMRGFTDRVDGATADNSSFDIDSYFDSSTPKPRPDYLPSPNQIRDECRRIREGWSEDEHWKRAGYNLGKPAWEVQQLHVTSPQRTSGMDHHSTT